MHPGQWPDELKCSLLFFFFLIHFSGQADISFVLFYVHELKPEHIYLLTNK